MTVSSQHDEDLHLPYDMSVLVSQVFVI